MAFDSLSSLELIVFYCFEKTGIEELIIPDSVRVMASSKSERVFIA